MNYPFWLWLLFVAFCIRVLGQVLVAFFQVRFLPPMHAWYSGLVPYRFLLPAQVVIIGLMGTVCFEISAQRGLFSRSNRHLGVFLLGFGILYLAVMIIRYVIHMSRHPDQRWIGGCIPIFFHWVLAAFVLVWASYTRRPL